MPKTKVNVNTDKQKTVRETQTHLEQLPDEGKTRLSLTDRLLEKLSRVTSSGLFIPEIDGLRFFAIAAVIAVHVSQRIPHTCNIDLDAGLINNFNSIICSIADVGSTGVRLFFVISGFILSLPFASHYLTKTKMPSLRRYYTRRVTRLEPPYIISLILVTLLYIILNRDTIANLLLHSSASLIYCHELIYGRMNPHNVVLWSLECEVQFYILAPFFAKVYCIHNKLFRRTTMLLLPITIYMIAKGITAASNAAGVPVLGWTLDHLLIIQKTAFFFAGFLLSDLYLTEWKAKNPDRKWHWDLAALFLWGSFVSAASNSIIHVPFIVREFLLLPVLIFMIYVAAFKGIIWNGIVRNRWIATTGGMCYSIYLYHDIVIRELLPHTIGLCNNIPVQIALHTILCSSICAVFFVLFEKPFMYKDWTERLQRRLRRLAGAAG